MAEIKDFPDNLLIVGNWLDPHLQFNTRTGGMALNGDEQVLSSLSARWEMRVGVLIGTEADMRSYRVLKASLRGKYNYLRLPLLDPSRITRADIGAIDPPEGVPFGDGANFSDGVGFSLAQPAAPVNDAALAGATSVSVPASYFSGAITAGVYFSLNDWLYLVEGWDTDGDDYIITLIPPLREDVAAGDVADFAANAIWQLAEDETGKLNLTEGGRHGVAELNLVEPVGRRLDAA